MLTRINTLSLRASRTLVTLIAGGAAGMLLAHAGPAAQAKVPDPARAQLEDKCDAEWIRYFEDVFNGLPATEPDCTPGGMSSQSQQFLGYSTLTITVYEAGQ
ncbi:MAG: hypothetical protein KDA21_11365 [Phycisphaerales bacterium]|nr:hypothetical protein [Phycisphaerales bacterium]